MLDRLEPLVRWLARTMAILGGLVLLFLVILTVASVTGRNLIFIGLGPIPGDFELVEAGTAFAIFAFLPWCQLNRGHASVGILTDLFARPVNNLIEVVADALMLAVVLYLGWRHILGTIDKYTYTETTFILQFPVWWAYAASILGLSVMAVVAVFCLLRSIRTLLTGGQPDNADPVH